MAGIENATLPLVRTTRYMWHLAPNELHPERVYCINWLDLLPAGSGSKHQRAYLTKAFRQFLLAFISNARADLSSATVVHWFYKLRSLAVWMTARNQWRLGELSVDDVIEFIATRPGAAGRLQTGRTHSGWIVLMQMLWELRTDYVGSLRVNPKRFAQELTTKTRVRPNRPWKAIDESIALPLIRDALSWIETHGEFVASTVDDLWKIRNGQVGVPQHYSLKAARFHLSRIEEEPGMVALRASLADTRSSSLLFLRRVVSLTEGACITAMLFLVGMRVSELVRLDVDCLVESVRTSDGGKGYQLKGIAAKQGDRARAWVVAEPIPDVVRLLVKLFDSARKKSGQKALFLGRHIHQATAPFLGRTVTRLGAGLAQNRMRDFSRSPFRVRWPSSVNLHPHAARKTFARFVVLRDKRALESLSTHFGHIHRAVTDGYYVGSDIELEKLISEEGRKELASSLAGLLESSRIGGKAGDALKKQMSVLGTKFRGKRALQTLVQRLIKEGVQLAPCDWGYCVYTQAFSACRGSERGPNEAGRSPDVCGGCANFAVTERHRSWWEERMRRESEFLRQPNLPDQTRQYVQGRMINTERILRDLIEESSLRRDLERRK